ncbi:TRAP-type C4-dicarboxylate transport system permease small subunit [Shimia isoporae]|uniref:TRAP transporter small permease protein n=1 Tax=Shimia isoporae TaxID=647720 RepID=A0A4R1NKX6_9RHOB|nr:TRAP transporter small permease subunit [Shimia isoporae]TCL08321.1 TRAP-type C4-dicarboxylate transport system permease small subunit [Shimia isoporae]
MTTSLFGKTLRALSGIASTIATGANAIGTLVVLGLVLIVNFDVVARGIFNAPFRGAYEVVQFAMVLIVFLQLPDVVRVSRLTRSDGFLVVIGHRFPRFANGLRKAIDTVSAVFMALIAVTIWPEFLDMLDTRDYFGVPGIFTAPWWPIKLTIFASAALCAVLFLFKVLSPAEKPELIRAPEHEDKE